MLIIVPSPDIFVVTIRQFDRLHHDSTACMDVLPCQPTGLLAYDECHHVGDVLGCA
jgi:hypothetical protein